MEGLYWGGLLPGLLAPVVLLGVVVLVAVALARGGAEPDPDGRRPVAAYVLGLSFVAMFVALFATTASAGSFARLMGHGGDFGEDGIPRSVRRAITCSAVVSGGAVAHAALSVTPTTSSYPFPTPPSFRVPNPPTLTPPSFPGPSFVPPPYGVQGGGGHCVPIGRERFRVGVGLRESERRNGAITSGVRSGLLGVAALAVLWVHWSRRRSLLAEGWEGGPARPVALAYVYVTLFVAVLALVAGTVGTGFAVFRTAAPGIAGSFDGRNPGWRQLIGQGALVLGALLVLVLHWRQAEGLRPAPAGDGEPAPPEERGPDWSSPDEPA